MAQTMKTVVWARFDDAAPSFRWSCCSYYIIITYVSHKTLVISKNNESKKKTVPNGPNDENRRLGTFRRRRPFFSLILLFLV
jgi:hypothetical protein